MAPSASEGQVKMYRSLPGLRHGQHSERVDGLNAGAHNHRENPKLAGSRSCSPQCKIRQATQIFASDMQVLPNQLYRLVNLQARIDPTPGV